jgi:hypothetical protein
MSKKHIYQQYCYFNKIYKQMIFELSQIGIVYRIRTSTKKLLSI